MSDSHEEMEDVAGVRLLQQSNEMEPLRLILVKYTTTIDGRAYSVSYRQNGKWIKFSRTAPGGWAFLDDEMLQFATDYIDYLDYCEDFHSLVVPALHEEAFKWFDLHENDEIMQDIREIYCSQSHHFEAQYEPDDRYRIFLRLDRCLWKRAQNGWEFTGMLSTREQIRMAHLTGAAQYHLGLSLSSEEREISASVDRYVALAYSASFAIIPTMESVLISAEDSNNSNWKTAESVLNISAEAKLYRNIQGQITQIAVTTPSSRWIRSLGEWVKSEPVLDSSTWEAVIIPFSRLEDAVHWWDATGSTLPPGQAPSLEEDTPSGSFAFVTDTDPFESDDFPLLDLVRGDVEDGNGASRQGRQWIHGHIPVLDSENHMPADVGDDRPWGGKYLQALDYDTALLAIEFWDHTGFNQRWSDFAGWLKETMR